MYLLQDLGYLKPRYASLHPSNFNGALEFHPLSVTSFQARPETNQCLCACGIGWSLLRPLAHIEKSQHGWSKISFASFHIMLKMRILVAQAASRSQQKVHFHPELFAESLVHLLTLFCCEPVLAICAPLSLSLRDLLPPTFPQLYRRYLHFIQQAKICPLRCLRGTQT